MATFKHISSKNANYGDAEKYLTFAHDEFSMKPTLDENGRLVPREDYRISTLNCGEEDFAVACMRSNLRYGKNQKKEDVKSHHYIISFDPRDGPDNGLTVDRAQELGEKFCAEHFPGHQALVCTHPDGHSHTENIHVHIVINSLRIAEVPMLPHMDRPADRKAGCKHRCTDAAMNYLKAEVMEMCHSEGLYQIDLLNGSKERITEREYWAQKKGQAALDRANAPIAADGIAPRQTKFETDKAKLRRTIREALAAASGFDEFAALLLRHGVTVKESRGRLSYLTPDRTKPITARKLGDDFDRAAVLSVLEQNAARAAEKPAAIAEYPGSIKDRLRTKKEAKNAPTSAKADPSANEVEFDKVSFTYAGAGASSLSDISFSVKKGQTVGIIGGTGCGKSTLVSLISRFYDVTCGTVKLNGRNVKELTNQEIHDKVGIVQQRSVLFKGSIRDNMKWGNENASDSEIWDALKVAQAKEVVEGKDGQLDFMLEQNGKNLSGGQRQRLTIARALVKKPEILILDDSLSALDFATDAALRKALAGLEGETTTFLVSQRVAGIRQADKILVLDNGELAGSGTHDELMKSCEVYREIYFSQFPEDRAKYERGEM